MLSRSARLFNELGSSNQEPGLRIIELARGFFRSVKRIQGRVDATKHRHRMKRDRILGAVGAEDAENIALLEIFPRQTCRRATYGFFELTKGQTSSGRSIDQRDFVRMLFSCLRNEISQRDFRNRNVRMWAAKDHSGRLR